VSWITEARVSEEPHKRDLESKLRERLREASVADMSSIPTSFGSRYRCGVRRLLGSHSTCFPFDPPHNISPLPASCSQVGQVKTLHQMKQGNSVPFSEFTLPLPETGNKFTITCHSYSLVDPVSVFGDFSKYRSLSAKNVRSRLLGNLLSGISFWSAPR
jgi:hypothetical protein